MATTPHPVMTDTDICDVCGEERRALIHTDTVLHPWDDMDGLTLHKFRAIGSPCEVHECCPLH